MRTEVSFKSLGDAGVSGIINENLPSGDPFTIGSNCIEVALVAVDRFENIKHHYLKIKGDNMETDAKEVKGRFISMRHIKQTIEYRGVSHFAGYLSTANNSITDPVKRLIRFYAATKLPPGGLLELHQSIVDAFVPASVEDEEQFLLTASQTYSKIFSEGGVRQAFGDFRNLKRFWYMVSRLNPSAIKDFYLNVKTDCIMSSILFMKVDITDAAFHRYQLHQYNNLERYVDTRPTLKKHFLFRDMMYNEMAVIPFHGIQVFYDHAIAISRTSVDIERFERRKKSSNEYRFDQRNCERYDRRRSEDRHLLDARSFDRVVDVQRNSRRAKGGGFSDPFKQGQGQGALERTGSLRTPAEGVRRQEEGNGGVDKDERRQTEWFGGCSNPWGRREPNSDHGVSAEGW